ncbi:MAG: hypothetical protein ACREHG_08675 [Candidatus Saccharimonadales bacterium]
MKPSTKPDARIARLMKGHTQTKQLPSEKSEDGQSSQISFHIERTLHRDVKSKLAKQDKSLKDLLNELLTEWNEKN